MNKDDSSTSGYGLGLFLSLRLAKYLGGDIEVQSEPNKGTKVRIEILADIAPPEEIQMRRSIFYKSNGNKISSFLQSP